MEVEKYIEPQYGIIGFYDILGYKSFLENNSVETVTNDINKVLHLISNIDKHITNQTLRIFNKTNKKIAKRLCSEMKWFIFSDTIIQISIFNKDEKPGSKAAVINKGINSMCRIGSNDVIPIAMKLVAL